MAASFQSQARLVETTASQLSPGGGDAAHEEWTHLRALAGNPEPVVLLHLTGGLGNQLFQYAAALRVVHEVSGRLVAIRPRNGWPVGHPSIADVLPGVRFAGPGAWLLARSHVSRGLRRVESGIRSLLPGDTRPGNFVQILSGDFDPMPSLPRSRVIVMHGLFQHRSWWNETSRYVAAEIAGAHSAAISHHAHAAAIAFRRTDYVRMRIELPFDFYVRAVAEAAIYELGDVQLVGEEKSFLAWGAAALGKQGLDVQPRISQGPLDDFWTLAGAQVLILANSSFSWWAARVGGVWHGRQKVVCPTPWLPPWEYAQTDGQAVDLCVSDWLPLASGFREGALPPTK